MGRGTGVRLTLPSGAKVAVSPRYRYALLIDAGPGSWVEKRSDSLRVVEVRRNNLASVKVYLAAHIYDVVARKRLT